MRQEANRERVLQLIKELGNRARGPGTVYLVGGSSLVLLESGRGSTIDVDLKLDPEPAGIFEAIAKLKNTLNMNIELAAPDQFIPEVPGWQSRSPLIESTRFIEFRHYDFYSQALAKLERNHDRDQQDVTFLIAKGWVKKQKLRELFEAIEAQLIRFPAINIPHFRQNVQSSCEDS